MGIVNKKYDQLKPELRYLADEVVLAQAWKKTHTYIRSFNWYADTLELDSSVVNLEQRLKEYKHILENIAYKPDTLKMVPAPKADSWEFKKTEDSEQWLWKPKKENKELRPLAHLSIKDQTINSAIMLCLADAVETAQGCTDPKYKHNVSSYGNRLFCDWEKKHARFRWGNSTTYSKYFEDYQRFLDRPLKKAKKFKKELGFFFNDRELYEVHLDLSAFYDHINIDCLLDDLKELCEAHYSDLDEQQFNDFWKVAKQSFDWQWDAESKKLNSCLKNNELPAGLPQGMVASGFFANAYLLKFDQAMLESVFKYFEGFDNSCFLVDYCRYVDDLRLLIALPKSMEPSQGLIDSIAKQVNSFLPIGLVLNAEKTKFESLSAKRNDVSARMKLIQSKTSGPMDTGSIDEMLGSLNGLMSLAEHAANVNNDHIEGCDMGLAHIDTLVMDVREDTVLRFAANRLVKLLKAQRPFCVEGALDGPDLNDLNRVYESIARRFIASWAKNPSMILLLKKAFELFPSPKLLQPVLEALKQKLIGIEPERRVVLYCIAELLRFSAVDLQRTDKSMLPAQADLPGYYEYLCQFTKDLLIEKDIPWYVLQQIYLFLAVQDRLVVLFSHKINMIADYKTLHLMLRCDQRIISKAGIDKKLPLLIIAYQISRNPEAIVSFLQQWVSKLQTSNGNKQVTFFLKEIAINNKDLFLALKEAVIDVPVNWKDDLEKIDVEFGLTLEPVQEINKCNGKFVALTAIISHFDNPFTHENALLVLMEALLKLQQSQPNNSFSLLPQQLEVCCANWDKILDPNSAELEIRSSIPISKEKDQRYDIPEWVSKESDNQFLYSLGCLLRSCAIGNTDFTAAQYLNRENIDSGYYGLKSSWYKRRLGMMHTPEALNGETAPMTNWITELLFQLLQWPGLHLYNNKSIWPENLDIKSLEILVLDRLEFQENLYGKSSGLPIYVEPIKLSLPDGQNFLKVVMVQSMLPRKGDFKESDIPLNAPSYRSKHAQHIASMAKMVCSKLEAFKEIKGNEDKKLPWADLIIFPELAIHEEDILVLQNLANKTGAIIYGGLVFHANQQGDFINSALWLIPSKSRSGRRWIRRRQGKWHMTEGEKELNIKPWRPYQLLIEIEIPGNQRKRGFRLAGTICFDATDLKLAADLRDHSDAFLIAALNQDIDTFDNMVDSLHYHMYQHVVLVNTGEFGGSVAKAPYKESYEKLIAHSHGNDQIAITMFDLNMFDFGENDSISGSGKIKKTPPAGLNI